MTRRGHAPSYPKPWLALFTGCATLVCSGGVSDGDVFENLGEAATRIPTGDPSQASYFQREGPKGMASEDFDGDGHLDLVVSNLDATLTILFGDGNGQFPEVRHLHTGGRSLRGVVTGEFTSDNHHDIVTADPYTGQLYTFAGSEEPRAFESGPTIPTWEGARDLVTGDFDHDGELELVIAGPGKGALHLKRSFGTAPTTAWFTEGQVLPEMNETSDVGTTDWIRNRRPVYALAALPHTDTALGHHLLVSHARAHSIQVYQAPPGRDLQAIGTIPAQRPHALVPATRLTRMEEEGAPMDLIAVSHSDNVITVHRGQTAAPFFAGPAQITLRPSGIARDVVVSDINLDGWNDLAVVLKDANRLAVYQNNAGTSFSLVSENPLGLSPRQALLGDFDEDGVADLVTTNRRSADLSVLRGSAGEGWGSPLIYHPTSDAIRLLQVADFDGNGLPDRIFATQSSSHVGLSLTHHEGLLTPPTLYSMGTGTITAMVSADVNADGHPDIITASWSGPSGSQLGLRLGDPEGTLQNYVLLTPNNRDAPYWVDLDLIPSGAGEAPHLAAISQEGNLVVFKLQSNGAAGAPPALQLLQERRVIDAPRDLAAVDLDDDSDHDLALLGINGEVVLIENDGGWSDAASWNRVVVDSEQIGSPNLVVRPEEPKLLVGDDTLMGLVRERAEGEALPFSFYWEVLQEGLSPHQQVIGFDVADPEARMRLATLHTEKAQLTLLPDPQGNGATLPQHFAIPPSKHVLITDLDGDGAPDLYGGGDLLWTVLSSRSVEWGAPGNLSRPPADQQVVINEIMAWNRNVPLTQDDFRTSDWLELYNGTSQAIDLKGWTLRLVKALESEAETKTLDYQFLEQLEFRAGEHLVLICSEGIDSPWHTGFKLPKEGGTLFLYDASQTLVDEVVYPAQRPLALG